MALITLDNLPVYAIDIDDDEDLGVDSIALVRTPAILVGWIAQKAASKRLEQAVQWVAQNDKMILTGPLSIPGQQIYRESEDEGAHFITYSSEVVRSMSERFLTKGNQLNLNVEHSDQVVMGSVVESWIKESDSDKSMQLGYKLPNGTWFISVKIADPAFWTSQVKTGNVKGFSLEGLFGHKILQNSVNTTLNADNMSTTQIIQGGIKGIDKHELASYQAVLKEANKLAKAGHAGLKHHLSKLEADGGMEYYYQNRSSIRKALTRASETPAVKQSTIARLLQSVADLVKLDQYEEEAPVEQMAQTLEGAEGQIIEIDEAGLVTIEGVQAPAGEYALSDGGIIVVDENSMLVVPLMPEESMAQGGLTEVLDQVVSSISTLTQNLQKQAKSIAEIRQTMRMPADTSAKIVKQAPTQVNQQAMANLSDETKAAIALNQTLQAARELIKQKSLQAKNRSY